ncbi:MAG: DUF4838 domain-containing protein [Kiritimatiellae bacterium]|nr:DUF4838 domain-containing protein [Kiritimatiellia bacterium]
MLSGGDAESPDADPAARQYLPFGTVYATYEFLERALGVRWYWPGELGLVAPKRSTVSLDRMHWHGKPSFDCRHTYFARADDPDISAAESLLWWRRLRHGALGGPANANHSFNDWPGRYGKTHPEYFKMRPDGSRSAKTEFFGSGALGGHVCLSNPDVFRLTVEDKRKQFDGNTLWIYGAVMPGDGDITCYCEACQAVMRPERGSGGVHGDLVWGFVNKVAAEVRKTHPNRFITCCSYGSYREVPEIGVFEPNVAVTLCTGSAAPFQMDSAGYRSNYVGRIKAWSEKTANLYVWDYWNLPRWETGQHAAPSIFPHALRDTLVLEYGRVRGRYLELTQFDSEGKDLTGIAGRSNWADWIYDALNIYVGFRLMWNMDEDVDAVLGEFYREFYGPAGPYVRRFYEAAEAAGMDPNNRAAGWSHKGIWSQTYPPAFVEKVMGYLRQAEEVSRGQEPYHARAAKTLRAFLPFEKASKRWTAVLDRAIRNETLAVGPASRKPVIDGNIADPCWRAAAVASEFCESFNSADLRAQTELRFLHDDTMLYMAIRAPFGGPKPRRVEEAGSKDRPVWAADDSVELFFAQGVRKYQLIFGPDDIYVDSYEADMTKKYDSEKARQWDCPGMLHKSRTGQGEWTAEVAIPLASLELARPSRADPWRVNFCRNYFYKEGGKGGWQVELSTWRPTFGSFHNVERFGTMWFE